MLGKTFSKLCNWKKLSEKETLILNLLMLILRKKFKQSANGFT